MGTVYNFLTRTVLHNIIRFFKFLFSFSKSYTGIVIFSIIVIVISSIIISEYNLGTEDGIGYIVMFVVISVMIYVFVFNIMIKGYAWNDEPRWARYLYNAISNFYQDISRSPTEQEAVIAARVKTKKEQIRERKRLIKEARKAEKNKFERFEILDME
jgi:hypothetical protein